MPVGTQFQVNTYTTSDQRLTRRSRGRRRQLRRGVAGATARPGRTPPTTASRGSATPRTDRRRAPSSRSTPTRRAIRHRRPWRWTPTGTSSWSGAATARPGRTRTATASRASATTRTGAAQGARVPGQHLHDERSASSRRWRRTAPGTSSWSGRATARPGRDTTASASRASATPRTDRRRGREFQVNTYTTEQPGRSHRGGRRRRELRRGVAEQRRRPGRTRTATASRASATTRTERRRAREFQVNTLHDQRPGRPCRGGGRRRRLRRGVGEQRLGWVGHELPTASRASATPRTERAQGGQFQVNTYTTSDQDSALPWRPTPTGTSSWCGSSCGSSGSDTSDSSVQGQRYASDGIAAGRRSSRSTRYTTSYQQYSRGRDRRRGNFVVVWQSDGSVRVGHELQQYPGPALRRAGSSGAVDVPRDGHCARRRPDALGSICALRRPSWR